MRRHFLDVAVQPGRAYFTFYERTIDILEDFVDKNLPNDLQRNVGVEGDREYPLDKFKLDDSIKDILYHLHTQLEGLMTSQEKIYVDEKGNCKNS